MTPSCTTVLGQVVPNAKYLPGHRLWKSRSVSLIALGVFEAVGAERVKRPPVGRNGQIDDLSESANYSHSRVRNPSSLDPDLGSYLRLMPRMTRKKKSMSMGAAECARRAGLTVRALRVYERHGLIEPKRTGKGWRCYGPRELQQLNVIVALKAFGMTLTQIRTRLKTKLHLRSGRDLLAYAISRHQEQIGLKGGPFDRTQLRDGFSPATVAACV